MHILKLKGMNLLCFVTPTAGWAERMENALGVPSQWPVMLVELLVAEDGAVWMSRATGVSRNSVRAFQLQGIDYYDFGELPDSIVRAIEQHFEDVLNEVRPRVNALMPEPTKPRLVLVKK